ncbi:hypothetical protein [Nocardia cyriacigeorgica]|uniref:hypothetical protein n=1 Tax=Nocardia cyriacigeorgica TaxID=135487 RepID=UPI00245455A0|nr:hypothetical protein [Nocardia cyriacigeorgica]
MGVDAVRGWIQPDLDPARTRETDSAEWNKAEGRWEIARRHLWVLTDAMADRFGEVDLFVQFSTTELCDTRCKNANPATVHDCVCACLGENHGGRGKPRDWQLSGATTLVSHGPIKARYKLIRRGEPRLVPITDETTQHQQPEPAPPSQPAQAPAVAPEPPTQITGNSTTISHRQPLQSPAQSRQRSRALRSRFRSYAGSRSSASSGRCAPSSLWSSMGSSGSA